MTDATDYPWNVRIDIGGSSFIGPGMESKQEAETILMTVEASTDDLQDSEVFRQ